MASPIERFEVEGEYIPQLQVMRFDVPYSDYETLIRRGYTKAEIIPIDDRCLSGKQRRFCYAMIGAIADYIGEEKSEVKEFMKMEFMTSELYETADRLFSLSNAPMSVVASFQRFLARFIIRHDIPTKHPLLGYIDDVEDYVYSCSTYKKCCICGKNAEPHHWNRLGMGTDRKTINHIGLQMQPLCRIHHTECHAMSQKEFDKKYHVKPVKIDEVLKKVWNFNGCKERLNWIDDWENKSVGKDSE